MKILVIDDDAAVRKFISITLQRKKHCVVEAENGKSGLLLLQEHRDISVMITDLIMPEKEGIETIIEVKKLYPAIKIIAISGGGKVSPENYLVIADALGANTTLKKPFSGQELMHAIDNL
ncbi:MAG: response regulator [Chlorobiaceae bacterium]|nr:response regulator [Chlorobiaceae bacterium]NTV17106.1 response regulator [Chlorobiaceae bacterium]